MSSTQQWQKDARFPQNQLAVVFSDTAKLPQMAPIYCNAAGNVAAVDKNNTVVTYVVTAGQWLPIMPVRINSTNTTVTAGSLIQVW